MCDAARPEEVDNGNGHNGADDEGHADDVDRRVVASHDESGKGGRGNRFKTPMRDALTGPMRSTPHRKAVEATAVPRTTVMSMASTTSGGHDGHEIPESVAHGVLLLCPRDDSNVRHPL